MSDFGKFINEMDSKIASSDSKEEIVDNSQPTNTIDSTYVEKNDSYYWNMLDEDGLKFGNL